MKNFNILNSQHRIDGLLMPANCVYGQINLKYTVKVDTGKTRQIYDKDGHIVFNNDGTPMIRKVIRRETHTQNITYSIWDLKPVIMGKDHVFKAWIKTPGGHWHETLLCRNAWMKELNNYVSKKLLEYCSANKTTLEQMWVACNASPHLHREWQCAQTAAGRRQVQTADDMLFRGHPCYALNPSIMTDGGRPKASMNKSVIATHKGAFNGMHGEEPARYDKPFVKADYKMVGKEPTFVKFVETPSGIMRFYNEREYNEYISAQK